MLDAHVPQVLRPQGLRRRGARAVATARSPASRARRSRSPATTPTATCAPRTACIAWCAKSPFDSNARRHTSFASVFVYPEVDDIDRGRDQPGRPARRRLPRLRRRRPARQQDRFGGAHHAPPDRHRGAVPERPLAAPQPRRMHGDAEVAASTSSSCASATPSSSKLEDVQDRHRLGPPDPLVRARPVAHQGPAHRRREGQHAVACSTATSTTSSTASLKQGV